MRRVPIVVSATVAGVGAMLGFHAHPAVVPVAAATSSAAAPTSAASSASAAATSSAASSGSMGRSATGEAMSTRYGPAQVRVTVSAGGKIVNVEAVELQNADRKSVEISSFAEPVLQHSVLARQTAAVDAVSGATYTSVSYEGSLQSALDKLGFKAADGSVASTDMSSLQ